MVHISMSLTLTLTFAHNFNLFLETCTYNLIVEAEHHITANTHEIGQLHM
jgi:hypothetical protein